MMIFRLAASLLMVMAVICFLNLTPQNIADDIVQMTNQRESISDKAKALRTGKKKKSIGARLIYTQDALKAMGKANKFALVVCSSLALFVVGAAFAILIDNVFLVPTFAAFFAVIPFVYVRNSITHYEKHITDELETTLSIITTSYLRNGDIISSVRENLDYIRPPLKDHFAAFLGDTGFISNIKDSIRNLKVKVDDDIFREWCDALIQCQDDNTLKDTLQPIITKLTDVRIVNSELTAMMSSVRIEYYTMVGMVVGNIPLLYVLNKDWFHTLMYETAGKITLGVCGLVIFVTYLFMLKFTKPVAYKG